MLNKREIVRRQRNYTKRGVFCSKAGLYGNKSYFWVNMSNEQLKTTYATGTTQAPSNGGTKPELPKAYRGMAFLKVTSVKHYTEKTFRFTCVRPDAFRFRSGEFAMVGLENGDKPLLRAYSIASPNWAEELEFYSIKVEIGRASCRERV